MWDQLKRTDIELAKQKLAELRNVTLRRHAEELRQLDSDEGEVDMLGRLVEGFADKYLNSALNLTSNPLQRRMLLRVQRLSGRNPPLRSWKTAKVSRRTSEVRFGDSFADKLITKVSR